MNAETSIVTATAFEITSSADCEQLFTAQQPPRPTRALPITAAAWQLLYASRLPAHIEPWWMDVRFDTREVASYLWVAPNLPCFSGHFPGQPILPGVMQLGWGVALANSIWPADTPTRHFKGMARVKFKAPVVPNCVLQLTLDKRFTASETGGHSVTHSLRMTLRSPTEELTNARLLYRD